MKLTKEKIRIMTSKELKLAVFDLGRSMTNYERSQYCKKLKQENKLTQLKNEVL